MKRPVNISSLCQKDSRIDQTSAKELLYNNLWVGLEFEIEGFNVRNYLEYFEITNDHSLRNGIEIRTRNEGLIGDLLVKAVDEYVHATRGANEHNLGWRTGFHVHVDVRCIQLTDLAKVLAVSAAVEPFIYAFCSNARVHSRFCVPLDIADDDTEIVLAASKAGKAAQARGILNNCSRYMGVNFKPTISRGTVEFRHMQGTNNRQQILDYINICTGIIDVVKHSQYRRPESLMEALISTNSPEELLMASLDSPALLHILHRNLTREKASLLADIGRRTVVKILAQTV
jgi:hypothetical protein